MINEYTQAHNIQEHKLEEHFKIIQISVAIRNCLPENIANFTSIYSLRVMIETIYSQIKSNTIFIASKYFNYLIKYAGEALNEENKNG